MEKKKKNFILYRERKLERERLIGNSTLTHVLWDPQLINHTSTKTIKSI